MKRSQLVLVMGLATLAGMSLVGCDEPKVSASAPPITRDATIPGSKGDDGIGSSVAQETEFAKKHGKDWVGSKMGNKK